MRPRIVVIAGPNQGQTYALTGDSMTIGRESANDIALNNPSVSRRHCVLERKGDTFFLSDLDSLNGTWVGAEAARRRPLAHGDRIRLGDYLLAFLTSEDAPVSQVNLRAGCDWDEAQTLRLRVAEAFHLMARDLSALMKISTRINSLHSLEELQRELLEQIFEVIPAQRGAILLTEEGEITAAFGLERNADPAAMVDVNLAAAQQAMAEGLALLSHENGLAMLCLPLLLADKPIGALYLDSHEPETRFDRDHLQLLTAIAGIAAVALHNARYVARLEVENQRLRAESLAEHSIIGESEALQKVLRLLAKAAPTASTVLLRGASGTGKEVAARALHLNSPRREGPFIALNCAALTETLLESELFGHEKGSFTGAHARKIGKIELAHEGSLFLDEVGEVSPLLQAKLLRVLQEREFERVGGTRPIKADIRVIAATNRDLEAEVHAGRFRADLYYRLNVVQCVMPPLRERQDDVLLLADFFIAKYAAQLGRKVRGLAAPARRLLQSYDWPGNVRELENAIERAVVLGSTELILSEDLPESLCETAAPEVEPAESSYQGALNETKKRLIREAVAAASGNYSEAARRLGLHPNYLHRLIRNLQIKDDLA